VRMLARIRDHGPVMVCDVCNPTVRDNAGVVAWERDGQARQSVLVLHKACLADPIVKLLCPHGTRQQPLSQYLETLLEGICV